MKYSWELGIDNYTIHESGWSSSPRAVVLDLAFAQKIVDSLNNAEEIGELEEQIRELQIELASTEKERQDLFDGAIQIVDMH